MCGIIGALPSIDEFKFKKGLKALDHRGPDGEGFFQDEHFIQLGHRRLSILDLSKAGSQPMHFDDMSLVFNGEIYNYLEVREDLKKAGYDFYTTSDSEVLLKAFHHWGKACLERFNGMWAFAVFNKRTKTLFASRDRYGVKPLYYFKAGSQLIFASEIKAIHLILGKTHPLEESVLKGIVQGRFDWHGGEKTWLKNVFILPAGSWVETDGKSLNVGKWYGLREQSVPNDFKEQAEYLNVLLKDACKIRLRSDVPIGTCLSGGIDSSSITSLINSEEGNYTHKSFCASFPNTPIDESAKARALATKLKSDLSIIAVLPPSISELELAMKDCDGPMHGAAFFPIWKLYQFIRSTGIKVTLDGQGPDEMMGGYRPIASAVKYAFRTLKPGYIRDIYNIYKEQGETEQFSSRQMAKKAVIETLKNEVKRPISLLLGRQSKSIYTHPFRSNSLDEEFYQEFFVSPLPGILQQYDRCSMAHGVECRMPFMDYRIVEYLFSLPIKSKIGNGFTKRVLREAMQGVVPDSIRLDKVKIGFNAPIVNWYKSELKDWMLDIMSSSDYQSETIFDGRYLKNNFEKFIKTESPQWTDAWQFWGSVHFMWWKKNG